MYFLVIWCTFQTLKITTKFAYCAQPSINLFKNQNCWITGSWNCIFYANGKLSITHSVNKTNKKISILYFTSEYLPVVSMKGILKFTEHALFSIVIRPPVMHIHNGGRLNDSNLSQRYHSFCYLGSQSSKNCPWSQCLGPGPDGGSHAYVFRL